MITKKEAHPKVGGLRTVKNGSSWVCYLAPTEALGATSYQALSAPIRAYPGLLPWHVSTSRGMSHAAYPDPMGHCQPHHLNV